MASYYYLVASLPELDLENVNIKVDLDEVYENIRINIEEDDLSYFKELLYLNDIKNLVSVISESNQFPVPHPKFSSLSNLDEEAIKDYHTNIDHLPDFIQNVLEEHEDKFHSMDPLQIENVFLQAYYEYSGTSSNAFINQFSAFDVHLRNIVTAINCRKSKKSIEDNLLDDEETTQALIKSSAKDFGLADKFSFINSLEELIENDQVWKLEQYVDKLRWSFCDELTSASFFTINNLLAYTIKLMIVKRRIDLNDEAGKERLQQLTEKALTQLEIPVGQ